MEEWRIYQEIDSWIHEEWMKEYINYRYYYLCMYEWIIPMLWMNKCNLRRRKFLSSSSFELKFSVREGTTPAPTPPLSLFPPPPISITTFKKTFQNFIWSANQIFMHAKSNKRNKKILKHEGNKRARNKSGFLVSLLQSCFSSCFPYHF